MADKTNSGFEISESDLYIFQGMIDFFAAATIDPSDTDAEAKFKDLAPAFLWNSDASNPNTISFLGPIYDMLMDTDKDDGSDKFNLFAGALCNTDDEIDAEAEEQHYEFCDLSYTQILKFVLLSFGVSFWINMIVGANVVAYFVNPYKEEIIEEIEEAL